MKQQHGKESLMFLNEKNFVFYSDEEKRKMCHSTSIKNLHQSSTVLLNNDDEQIRDLMTSLLDQIDKGTNDSTYILFNASSTNRHRASSDNNDDLFQSLDSCKHSSGILVDEKELSSRKIYSSFLFESMKTYLFKQRVFLIG